jgi:hypothetical protein
MAGELDILNEALETLEEGIDAEMKSLENKIQSLKSTMKKEVDKAVAKETKKKIKKEYGEKIKKAKKQLYLKRAMILDYQAQLGFEQ